MKLGRKRYPRRIGNASVEKQRIALARAVTDAVAARLASGDLSLDDLAKSMQTEGRLVWRYLHEPASVKSLHYLVSLAMAAGLTLKLEVQS